jgi:ubiquinone/menaquinone biosynthesis C-methylase UbiE
LQRLIWESDPVLSWQRLTQGRSSSAAAKHPHGQIRFYRETQTELKQGLIFLSLFMAIRYHQLANQFDERYHHQSFPRIQDWLRRLASSPGDSRILEVGCGTGHWLNILSDLPIELIGIDPSYAILEKARAHATRAGLLCAYAESIPFQARSFDLIFCINAFHHFSDPKKFLSNSRLLLRNGGRLAIFGLDPHASGTDWYLYDYFSGVRDTDQARYLPTREIGRLMAQTGFRKIIAEPAEHIQKTFEGEAVFEDPFLVKESTSQLLLLSEVNYQGGQRAIAVAVEDARRHKRSVRFNVDLTLFGIVGEVNT